MAEFEPLSKQLIEKALRADDLKFMVDSDGDFRADFTTDKALGDFNGIFSIAGKRENIFRAWGFFDLKIPGDQLPKAIYLCNEYQVNHLWPGVYVNSREDANGKTGIFVTQSALDCEGGITVEVLQRSIGLLVGGSFAFCDWIAKQPQFWKRTES